MKSLLQLRDIVAFIVVVHLHENRKLVTSADESTLCGFCNKTMCPKLFLETFFSTCVHALSWSVRRFLNLTLIWTVFKARSKWVGHLTPRDVPCLSGYIFMKTRRFFMCLCWSSEKFLLFNMLTEGRGSGISVCIQHLNLKVVTVFLRSRTFSERYILWRCCLRRLSF